MMDYKCPRCDIDMVEPMECDKCMEDLYRIYMESVTDRIESAMQYYEEIYYD